ncbi:hypothetical protein [Acetobacter senegalensis]|nr:hypothetical protein [Acetobacter senegalensis]
MTTALLTIDVQQAIDSPLSRSFNLQLTVLFAFVSGGMSLFSPSARTADIATLPVLTPVILCEALDNVDLPAYRHIMVPEPCDPTAGYVPAAERDQNHVQGVGLAKPTYVFSGTLFPSYHVQTTKPDRRTAHVCHQKKIRLNLRSEPPHSLLAALQSSVSRCGASNGDQKVRIERSEQEDDHGAAGRRDAQDRITVCS